MTLPNTSGGRLSSLLLVTSHSSSGSSVTRGASDAVLASVAFYREAFPSESHRW